MLIIFHFYVSTVSMKLGYNLYIVFENNKKCSTFHKISNIVTFSYFAENLITFIMLILGCYVE